MTSLARTTLLGSVCLRGVSEDPSIGHETLTNTLRRDDRSYRTHFEIRVRRVGQ